MEYVYVKIPINFLHSRQDSPIDISSAYVVLPGEGPETLTVSYEGRGLDSGAMAPFN